MGCYVIDFYCGSFATLKRFNVTSPSFLNCIEYTRAGNFSHL